MSAYSMRKVFCYSLIAATVLLVILCFESNNASAAVVSRNRHSQSSAARRLKMKRCVPQLRRTCHRMAYVCHAPIMSKRSISNQDSRPQSVTRPRGRRFRRVRVSCGLCEFLCWK